MEINLVPDSSVAFAPAGFTAAIEAAASVFDQDFPGGYTVNISYGWGTFLNNVYGSLTDPGDGVFSVGGGFSASVSYTQLKDWLTARAASSSQIAAVASLPASSASFPNGASMFSVSFAEEKALGVFYGDPSAIDGGIGFNTADGDDSLYWEAAAITELAHALGWNSIAQGGGPYAADLFRYSAPGVYGWTSGQAAYFSIDGGNTDQGDFSTSFDQTLFSDLPALDSLRLPLLNGAATLSSFDIEALSVIGFGVVSPPPPRHFIAGGNSPDILWQNVDGRASIWKMADNTRTGGGPLSASPGPSWSDVATGDFNSDGQPDILWQNAGSGQVAIWEMNGGARVGGGRVNLNPGPSWSVIGTGDFNKDGLSDILWQNASTGQASIWDMNGNTRIGGGPVLPNPGTAWTAVGTGDFNGDGFADILWQKRSTGQVSIWEMDGTARIGGGPVASTQGPEWKALGTGDFNKDGFSDILFQDVSTGQIAISDMDGSSQIGGGAVTNSPGLSWTAVGTGDFNNDGHSDILWQNANGQASIWEMSDAARIGGGPVSPNPGPSWHAA